MKRLLLPINILIILLSILVLGASFSWSQADGTPLVTHARNLVSLFLAGLVVRTLIQKFIDPVVSFRLEHRIITALILFLLFDPLLPWWIFPLLGIITEAGQYFFRVLSGPIFNPAAFGAIVLSLFGYLPAWWGVNFSPKFPLLGVDVSIAALFTLLLAGYVAHRYRKLPIAVSALLMFSLSYFLLLEQSPLYIVLEGTLLFFLLVMATEPKTSPIPPREQYLYGALIGLFVSVGIYFHFIEAYVIALLLGNLYTKQQQLPHLFRTMLYSEHNKS